MFDRPKTSLPLVALLFVLPQTLFAFGIPDPAAIAGRYLAVGIRFPFFRYQESVLGSSFISVPREIQHILSGNVGGVLGKTAVSTYFWIAGLAALLIAAALVISWQVLGNPGHAGFPGPLLVLSGAFFLCWPLLQFGPLFSSVAGYGIPVGVPFFWYAGFLFIQAAKGAGEEEGGEEGEEAAEQE